MCVCVHSVKCMSSMGMWVMLSVTVRGPPFREKNAFFLTSVLQIIADADGCHAAIMVR